MYTLVMVVLGLHCRAFSSFRDWGPFSSCGARASHCGGFSCCRALALGCMGFSWFWLRGSQEFWLPGSRA